VVEILLWLVPPVVVTVVAMAWVGWLGREGRGEVDREEAVRRMGAALEREPRPRDTRHQVDQHRERERSTGVAVRRTPRRAETPAPEEAPEETPEETPEEQQRRAS
jgi:hypothetical protein